MAKQNEYTGPMRFAHRGLAQYAPENTLGAFEAAIEHGLEGIEIDVQLSGDGEIIVAHDGNFTRMTLGHPTGFTNGVLNRMTWEDIKKVELPYANHMLPSFLPAHTEVEDMAIVPGLVMGQYGGSFYEDELINEPRMAHIMRFCDFDKWFSEKKENVLIEIEIKSTGLMPRMLEILKDSDNCARYILFSGSAEINREIQDTFRQNEKPEGLKLGANIRFLTEKTKKFVEENDLFEVGLNAESISGDDIRWLKERGVQILSNLGDYPSWWEQLVKLDVHGFKTNYAEAVTEWWEDIE